MITAVINPSREIFSKMRIEAAIDRNACMTDDEFVPRVASVQRDRATCCTRGRQKYSCFSTSFWPHTCHVIPDGAWGRSMAGGGHYCFDRTISLPRHKTAYGIDRERTFRCYLATITTVRPI
jgi:hypothetical protein